jgi:LPXTG-site transpeptidase (sortase) family protein
MTRSNYNITSLLGTGLILCSLVGFFILLFPIASIYLFPPRISVNIPQKGTYISIPKIYAQSPIIEEVDPWKEKEYTEALKKGVAQAKGTSLPGEKGTIFLFAHSSGNPLEANQYNTIFFRLGELVKGDEIVVLRNGEKFVYSVREAKVVLPTETKYLTDISRDQLILQTCTPVGTNLKRLLVFADPV